MKLRWDEMSERREEESSMPPRTHERQYLSHSMLLKITKDSFLMTVAAGRCIRTFEMSDL